MNPTLLTHENISRRARELWLSRGSPAGSDLEIWLEAERSLQNQASEPPRKSARNSDRRSRRPVAADEVDEGKLENRLADFGEPDRRSVTSAEPN